MEGVEAALLGFRRCEAVWQENVWLERLCADESASYEKQGQVFTCLLSGWLWCGCSMCITLHDGKLAWTLSSAGVNSLPAQQACQLCDFFLHVAS